ncbi:hypothetical protein OG921_18140 [Aldersonia sp. NBC_00410]|uniref:hypothetical protein n=1 Tax=Aldersonia sp. NBC_00410 TaxID=2975954 RepID=UPI0022588ADF|nr:hypothetical protein [Aldersonia sp. NBC_00410]MCX5045090.1 hypothetical protein [Aldersonia sp. NBC_00410]
MRLSRILRARFWLVCLAGTGIAVPTGVGLVMPGIANSDPGPAPSALAVAVDTLEARNDDPTSLGAAESIIAMGVAEAANASDLMTGYQSAVQGLAKLGIDPFLYPTAAPFCAGGSALPLHATPAAAGAVPGPWPKLNVPLLGPVNAVQPGQTLFAFVPYGLASDPATPAGDQAAKTGGMQVAWFNLSTLKGGFAPMGTVAETAEAAIPTTVPTAVRPMVAQAVTSFLTASMPLGGVRAVPVETGEGTVLAAVFGTVRNGETSCFFFPTVGITEVS